MSNYAAQLYIYIFYWTTQTNQLKNVKHKIKKSAQGLVLRGWHPVICSTQLIFYNKFSVYQVIWLSMERVFWRCDVIL